MAILKEPFYHNTISLLTGVFGSVFDEIKIVRRNGKEILVPIAYQVKRHYVARDTQDPNPDLARKKIILPRLSFKLNGLQKDPSRQLSRYQSLSQVGADRLNDETIGKQFNRVAYNFQYQLAVKTKTIDDMLQILEQILVYFNPSIRVTVLDNPDLDSNSAITIRLLDESIEEIFEGSFENEEVLESTLNFELEGWLYMPTTQSKVIKKVTINYLDLDTGDFLDSTIELPEDE